MNPGAKDFLSDYTQLWLEQHGCLSTEEKIRGYCADTEYSITKLRQELKKLDKKR